MTDLIQQAINKIDSEADKIGGTHAKLFASHVIDNYLTTDDNAQNTLDKELKNCIKSITAKAQRQAIDNCAVVLDDTVYGWLVEFYGFASPAQSDNIVNLFDLL